MTTVTAGELFRDVALILGWDPDNLDEREWKDIRDTVSHALKKVWDAAWWPDLCRTYHTAFKPSWSQAYITAHSTYPADTILWDPFSGAYYQALAATATRPTTYNAGTGEWDYTPGVWHPSPNTETASEWLPTATYATGDVVEFDDETYVAMTSVAAGETHSPALEAASWHKLIDFAHAYPHTGWAGREPVGLVRSITERDPRTSGGPGELEISAEEGETIAFNPSTSKVWVRYRINCPKLVGDILDTSIAYTVAPVDQQIAGEVITADGFVVYWGPSSQVTLTGSQVLALSGSASLTDVERDYDFSSNAAPGKYLYLAWPHSLGDQLKVSTGFMSGPFPVAMAGFAEGYTLDENGWGYMVVSVAGTDYRVYRTFYPMELALTITVLKA